MDYKFISQFFLIILVSTGLTFLIVERNRIQLQEIEKRGNLYLKFLEPSLRSDYRKLNLAKFRYYSNPNRDTLDSYLDSVVKWNQFITEIQTEIQTYPWRRFSNTTARRTFELIENIKSYSVNNCNLKWLTEFEIAEPGLDDRNCSEYISERNYEFNIEDFVKIIRENSKNENPVYKILRSQFQVDGKDILNTIHQIWKDIKPFYEILKPIEKQEKQSLQISSSATGNIKNWTLQYLYQEVDRFYASKMGWNQEKLNFWNRSLIQENGVCYNRVLCDLGPKADDCRISACHSDNESVRTVENLIKAKSNMFLVKYYQMSSKQPYLPLRGLGSEILPRAIAEVFNLIPGESRYKFFDLRLDKKWLNSTDELRSEAMKLFHRLGRYMSNQQWIWDLLENKVPLRKLNIHYWNLKKSIEGFKMDDSEFKPACWSSVNLDDSMKFLVDILKYQIHAGLCKISGFNSTKLIYLCDFTDGPGLGAVRRKLNEIIKLGSGKYWLDILYELTGKRQVSSNPVLEYFRPILNPKFGNYD